MLALSHTFIWVFSDWDLYGVTVSSIKVKAVLAEKTAMMVGNFFCEAYILETKNE